MRVNSDKIKKLYKLVTNDFQKRLLDSAIKNLGDDENELQFNNFAYSIRELSRHILHSLSPQKEVLKCKWYRNLIKDTTNGVTRGQRIKYAIQGGLDDNTLNNQVIDIKSVKIAQTTLVKTIELLSKYTHINEDTFDIDSEKVKKLTDDVIDSFIVFVETMKESKSFILRSIEDNLSEEVIQHTLENQTDEVDMLSTHQEIDEINIDEIKITKIGADKIDIKTIGSLDIILQYGSSGDQRRGDGHRMTMNFPFECIMYATFKKKIKFSKIMIESFEVNTDKFYE